MDRKACQPTDVKFDDTQGVVVARVSTFDVVDKDGDVLRQGAFGEQPTRMVWGHDWREPIGKGRVYEVDGAAVFEGRFFLETAAGRERYETVKAMGDLQEWSYGFTIDPAGIHIETIDGKQVRVIGPTPDGQPSVRVHEVSPVLVGAGEHTATLAIKAAKVALPSHSTETTDRAWNAAEVVAALPNDPDVLAYVHAWRDPDGDPTAKSSYKFPHHHGADGPANIRAAVAIIATLNGARGGADIPDADREGVWRHAARHLRDAGREPAELRSADAVDATLKLVDELTMLPVSVGETVHRLKTLAELRRTEGRTPGRVTLAEARKVAALLRHAADDLEQVAAAATPPEVLKARTLLNLSRSMK